MGEGKGVMCVVEKVEMAKLLDETMSHTFLGIMNSSRTDLCM
jgi:hypothetical protein